MVRRKPASPRRVPPRGRTGGKRRNGAPLWLWVVAALALGGFGYFLYWLSTGLPEPPGRARPPTDEVAATAEPKAGAAKKREPRFTFYTLLPEKEVVVPEGEVRTLRREEHLGRAPRGEYFIQAGSFRRMADADRLKARLALLGVESRIERAEVKGAVWYRVRLGPFASMTEVERVRSRLRKHRIDSVVHIVKR